MKLLSVVLGALIFVSFQSGSSTTEAAGPVNRNDLRARSLYDHEIPLEDLKRMDDVYLTEKDLQDERR